MQKESDELSICPSFSSYSSNKLAEVAINVSEEEFRSTTQISNDEPKVVDYDESEEEEFEFAVVRTDLDSIPEVPVGGERSVFPIFNRDLLLEDDHEVCKSSDVSVVGASLKELFMGERDVPSSSSSEADELERVPPGSYCVWTPNASPGRCKKSKSTGSSSKRWRSLRDLLRRSNSDGKDPYVFLQPSTTTKREPKLPERIESSKNTNKEKKISGEAKVAGKSKEKEIAGRKKVSAHEVFYVSNRAMKEGDKKRSYLPYRQDIVGFFSNNVNGLGLTKTFPPF